MTDGHEQKTAAYLGYDDLKDLRRLAMSWPVLKAFLKYRKISNALSRKAAFRHIKDAEARFTDVNPDTEWPLGVGDPNNSTSDTRSRHLAALLLGLEKDLETFAYNPEDNLKQNNRFRTQFQADLTLQIADGNFEVPGPTIARRDGESRLESTNRCWSLLQYLKHVIQSKAWEKEVFAGSSYRSDESEFVVRAFMHAAQEAGFL